MLVGIIPAWIPAQAVHDSIAPLVHDPQQRINCSFSAICKRQQSQQHHNNGDHYHSWKKEKKETIR
jgi:hypothetical protein